ncbi:MAG: hypothetical protein JRH11_16415 [Deltaproteobacteria bacterium]|nr:hypothetical protein [Deltaproteobacteria bacterium]
MSFWSDSSPIVKGAIVVGIIGLVVAIMAYAGVGPFATDIDDAEMSQQRGL